VLGSAHDRIVLELVPCSLTTALLSHAECQLHEMGLLHPESPQRLRLIRDALNLAGLTQRLALYDAPSATDAQLSRVHDPRHLAALEALTPQSGYVPLDLETRLNPSTMTSARRAAGANIRAVQLVAEGEVDNAFCCVRPPGHHAERDRPVGFCFVNSLAVGVSEALARDDVERVAIVDFDVHHGNGTEHIFYDDPRVMICSTFQALLLPQRLFSEHEDRIINVPLGAGAGTRAFREAVVRRWLPALERFDPDFLFISAGFDAHWLDTVSGINLTEDDFAWVTRELRAVAERHCGGRLVSSLEGGYHVGALPSCVSVHVGALMH